jgi:serine/threonine protein kinase
MELCPDGDVHAQELSEVECWQLLAAVGHALAHIHANELLHLDVSPSNIFRSESGFKLGDFGTLKVKGEFKPDNEGAGAYAAPEVFTEPEIVSGAADVYSLGVCVLRGMSNYITYTESKVGRLKSISRIVLFITVTSIIFF